MISGLLDQAKSVLEKKFLKNAFLPVLLLPLAILLPVILQGDRLATLAKTWETSSTTYRLLILVTYFVAAWFLASIVASQWRNIIRLFEGYPVERLAPGLARSCRLHQQARAQHIDSSGRWYELYYDYPEDERDFLPTRLGNVLRAAERHAYYRFGLDTIIMWPRLVHVAPQQFLLDVDEARASLEFLLVLSLWFYTFGSLELLLLLAASAPTWLALCCFLTGVLGGYGAYLSSLGAAREYGEQLRAGSELYRHDILHKYKIEVPPSVAEEKRTWIHLREFLGNARDDRSWTYAETGVPEVIVHLDPVASRRGVSRRNRRR